GGAREGPLAGGRLVRAIPRSLALSLTGMTRRAKNLTGLNASTVAPRDGNRSGTVFKRSGWQFDRNRMAVDELLSDSGCTTCLAIRPSSLFPRHVSCTYGGRMAQCHIIVGLPTRIVCLAGAGVRPFPKVLSRSLDGGCGTLSKCDLDRSGSETQGCRSL